MDNKEIGLAISPLQSLTNRPVQPWIPFPGTKRKASAANLDDKFDADCRPAPPKQFAVDEEVANDILRNGFYYDPSIPPVKENNVMEPIAEDDEMNDCTSTIDRDPGDTRNDGDGDRMKLPKLDGKECCDSVTHSMHESHLVKASSHSLSMNGVSLILSNEIQETLAQKQLSADFLLHKRIQDQMAQANSMALVLWKPPVVGPVGPSNCPVKKEVLQSRVLKEWKKSPIHEQTPSLRNPTQLPYLPIISNVNSSHIQMIEDGEVVEMDTSP
ncbi:unnamed protein product [Orchesella dallaii]|uniref:Uncharacterized protein n=1 Tax=Orchesella dallaii TaxID=48710 RepID=A0ABP1RL23_9HEXA